MPQATKDLVAYTTLNPGACAYDVRQKCYVASERMRTVLQQADFGEAMHDMASAMMKGEADGEFILGMTRPQRTANLAIFRKLSLAAYRSESVEASYWSIRSGASVRRRMSPRAFGFDGLRWHLRAFCHRKEQFLDFVIGRFESVGRAEPSPFADRVDSDWIENVELQLRPNPGLDLGKKRALEMDYGMEDGQCILTVRKAMKIYTLRRLGFVGESMAPPMLNELKELLWVE
jgi:predicted DNA-binding transcriptional regulator YafY